MKNIVTLLLAAVFGIASLNVSAQSGSGGKNSFNLGFASKADVASEFAFDHSVHMEIQSYSKKGKADTPVNYEMLLGGKTANFGARVNMEGTNSVVIWDVEKNIMVTLVDNPGMKMGIAMKFDASALPEDTDEDPEYEFKFKKTGRTKTILGYECMEYTTEDDDTVSEFWMAPNLDLNLSGPFSAMMMNAGNDSSGQYPSGFMMELISTGKKKGEKTVMRVTKIEKDKPTKISTSGYSFMH